MAVNFQDFRCVGLAWVRYRCGRDVLAGRSFCVGWVGQSSCFLLALAVVGLSSSAALAELKCRGPEPDRVQAARTEVPARVRLERIDGRELLAGQANRRRVSSRLKLRREFFAMRRVERRIAEVWRRQVPAALPLGDIRVEHKLKANGRESLEAVQTDNVEFRLPVVLRPTRPRVLCRRGDKKIVAGGVILEMPLSSLPAAGRYHLQIETKVTLR